ncbi:MAG TPA: phosphate ABC transporter substrate-binding protein PstS [Acidimicrobiales bacterium]|nr:phosphate ABC transporter substrate-binding protein PstS [Acidimicrobiales bacterium]
MGKKGRPWVAAALAAGLALTVVGCSSAAKAGGSSSTTNPGSATAVGGANDLVTAAPVTLDGAGANSIDPFFERVFYDYHQANPKVSVHYSPAGSSAGIKDVQQATVDFGDSEIPMSSTDLAKAHGAILQIPVDLGGVALSYNLPAGPRGIKLDGPTLAGIFTGSITKWDDPAITALNPGATLPPTAIVPVHRADSSGPGWDLDAYLIKTAPAWVARIGTTKPSKTWPVASVGVGQQLNSGIATYIKQTPGAIGFVEFGYALRSGFVNAALKSGAGDFVAPSISSITAAGSVATTLSAKDFSIIDEPGAGAYPLANFSWTLVPQKPTDGAKGLALGKLLDYVVTTGQQVAPGLGYAPLPASVVTLAQQTIATLENPSGGALFRAA